MTKQQDDQVLEALSKLDPDNKDHWNSRGAPQMDAVKSFLPEGIELTRQDLLKIAPDLTRDVAAKLRDEAKANGTPPAKTEDEEPAKPDDKAEEELDEGDKQGTSTRSPDEKELFNEQIAKYREVIDNGNKRMDNIRKEVQAAEQAIDNLMQERDAKYPPLSAGKNIKIYLKSQLEQRRLRVEGTPKSGMSQIDQAMSRRTGYGHKRPVVGVKA